ncbi:MAG TPA: hypothetical protein VF157_02210, partial [Chloroflexota bacterium]
GVEAAVRVIAGSSDRLTLLLWQDFAQDPNGGLKAWLDAHAVRLGGRGAGQTAAYQYVLQQPLVSQLPDGLTPVRIAFGGQIELAGFRLWSGLNHTGLRLQLGWQRLAPLQRDYSVYVHLVDGQGRNLAIADHRPAYDTLNLSQWKGQPYLVDEYDLPGDWSGADHLELGLYDRASGERLPPEAARLPLPSQRPS